jgi:hypothetical protein
MTPDRPQGGDIPTVSLVMPPDGIWPQNSFSSTSVIRPFLCSCTISHFLTTCHSPTTNADYQVLRLCHPPPNHYAEVHKKRRAGNRRYLWDFGIKERSLRHVSLERGLCTPVLGVRRRRTSTLDPSGTGLQVCQKTVRQSRKS